MLKGEFIMMSFFPGSAVMVSFVSIPMFDAFGERSGQKHYGLKTFVSTGGAISAKNEDTPEFRSNLEKLGANKAEKELALALCGIGTVTVFDELKEILTPEELKAVLLHEEGHLIHRHLEKINSRDVIQDTSGQNILVDVNAEIEADAYAASRVGKEIVKKAITKLVIKVADICMSRKPDLNYSDFLFDPVFRARINALM